MNRYSQKSILILFLSVFVLTNPAKAAKKYESFHEELRVAPLANKSLLYVIRAQFFGGSSKKYSFFLDSKVLGVLPELSYLIAYVEPGSHIFWTPRSSRWRRVNLKAGKEYVILYNEWEITSKSSTGATSTYPGAGTPVLLSSTTFDELLAKRTLPGLRVTNILPAGVEYYSEKHIEDYKNVSQEAKDRPVKFPPRIWNTSIGQIEIGAGLVVGNLAKKKFLSPYSKHKPIPYFSVHLRNKSNQPVWGRAKIQVFQKKEEDPGYVNTKLVKLPSNKLVKLSVRTSKWKWDTPYTVEIKLYADAAGTKLVDSKKETMLFPISQKKDFKGLVKTYSPLGDSPYLSGFWDEAELTK